MMVGRWSSFSALCIACSASLFGCGADEADRTLLVPVVETALDRSFQANHGLVTVLDERGWPVREGDDVDPVITEARRFYDTVQAPYAAPQVVDYPDPFTGEPPGPRLTAPLTFEAWKQAFRIPPRAPDEALADYRARAGVVIYYNKNELGLGRELGCAEFDDGTATDGSPLTGIACYVTNYGTAFRDVVNSLPLAADGAHPKNTVCITYRPSMDPDYQIQFYTYDGDGLRREWAQLDTLGPRPLPQVCMNCHGGSYDGTRHLAKHARFLPLDPNVVVFADADGATRAEQEERIRAINHLSARTPLTTAQHVMLDELYGGALAVAGTASRTEWAPEAWSDSDDHRVLFDKVVKPSCATCHAAMQNGPDGAVLATYSRFESPALLDAGLLGVLCGSFTMPNSQATLLSFWEPAAAPIVSGGESFDTAAELMLARVGVSLDECSHLEVVADCNRSDDPDELCGNAFSGRACNRVTGQCAPDLRLPRKPGEPNGVCKTDGSRGCPYPEQCRSIGAPPPPGLEGYDGVCVP